MAKTGLEYWQHCLGLGSKFENPPEVLDFELHTVAVDNNLDLSIRDHVINTGYQCYAEGITKMKPRSDEKSQEMADSTLDAGHHTTRMHYYATWKLRTTRDAIHGDWHGHPNYNSEQQSQRYAKIKEGNFLVPVGLTEKQRGLFMEAGNFANSAYFEMLPLLAPEIGRRMKLMYPVKGWEVLATKTRLEEKAVKLAQEIARYLLPVNQFSVMDHTLNELQLLRSFRGSAQENVRDETRYLLAKMIEKITEGDKSILEELREPVISARGYGTSQQYISENKAEFDDSLGGRTSKLELFDPRSREVVARAIRNVLGVSKSQMSDHEALMRAMDPAQNGLLADVFETGINDPLTQCLQLFNFQFATVLSHSGHSQGQRHRGVSGAVPPIESMFDGTADYFVPMIVKEDPKLFEWYQKKSEQIFYNVNRCLESGMPKKAALMLIPNSFNIRFFETGNLSPTSLFHKDKLRLCLNAQEEIFFSVLDQVEQTIAVLPEARVMLLAPCGVRTAALIRPRCPEGKRWCGQQIWGEPIEDYRAGRLI